MEFNNLQDNILVVAAVAGLVGLIIGWLITYLAIGRGPSKTELTGKLSAVEEEFDAHKENVDKHFETTSELVNELTESYVKVYKHLSQGAEQLSGVVDMRHRISQDDSDNEKPVIEGALASTAAAAVAGAAGLADSEHTPHVDDPEFTVSDAAVEETLTELEASATTTASTPAVDPAEPSPNAVVDAAQDAKA